tara:strand:+ start:148447 stop:148686 length:240 start_codon:yes stop_codon:yes gene_type:complete
MILEVVSSLPRTISMTENPLPDELTVRQTIVERTRELWLLKLVVRALAKHRREHAKVEAVRNSYSSPKIAVWQQGGDNA